MVINLNINYKYNYYTTEQIFSCFLKIMNLLMTILVVLNDEQQHAQAAGLNYANVPLNPSEANPELVEKAIW